MCESEAACESVRPGINDPFTDAFQSVDVFLGKFEVPDREIFVEHGQLVEIAKIPVGSTVADIGCGTGLFMAGLHRAVGPQGTLYCLETAEKFIPYLQEKNARLPEPTGNVHVLLSGHKTIPLPNDSVDLIVMVDTYHHIEYPSPFLTECARVLKAGGQCFVVDFEKIEGVSSEFVQQHVRASKEIAFQEWQAGGFDAVEVKDHPLKENWIARFFVKK